MRRTSKKGQAALDTLAKLVVALLAVGVVLTVGFLVIAEVQDQVVTTDSVNENDTVHLINSTSIAYNASRDVQTSMATIPGWLSIIVISVIGAALLGLVAMFTGRRK